MSIGPRQRQIIAFLQAGPATLNAIISRFACGHPARVHSSLKALADRGLVVSNRQGKHDLSAMVALAAGADLERA